jgi:hypothetical protein
MYKYELSDAVIVVDILKRNPSMTYEEATRIIEQERAEKMRIEEERDRRLKEAADKITPEQLEIWWQEACREEVEKARARRDVDWSVLYKNSPVKFYLTLALVVIISILSFSLIPMTLYFLVNR